jgi:predicted transcriptional regulator
MPISIHVPDAVLRRVDRRAKGLGLSRSGYITQALERDLAGSGGWSEGFFDQLRDISEDDARAAASLGEVIRRRRSRKGAPRL